MKKILTLIAALLIGAALIFCSSDIKVSADVGNNNSYGDSGSSGGFSGSDWGSSGSDWSYSDSSSGGVSIGGGSIPIPLIIVLVAIYLYSRRKAQVRSRGVSSSMDTGYVNPQVSMSIEAQIREHDPDFSVSKFISWAEEVFIALQNAWTDRDWKKIRPFENEALFNKHNRQLEEYIRNNTINVIERICVNESTLSNYTADNQYEYLTVYMKTRMNDYIINADTREVVKGDKDREFYTNYNLKFMRSLGVKTTVNSGKSVTNCPNCGAPTQITSSGECEYCNSVITTGQHDWVLCDLDSVQ
jgi:hypothetical protein